MPQLHGRHAMLVLQRRVATACAVLLLVTAASGFPGPFTGSRLYSAGKVQPLPTSPVLDVWNGTSVGELVARRAYKGNVIVFQFESSRHRWLDFALNMAAQLEAVGYHHYVALAAFEVDCTALFARWRELFGTARPLPPCAFNSHPEHGHPWRPDIHGIWAGRWGLVTSLMERGVSVLLLDMDMAIHRDVYAELDEPCMANATLVMHAEGGGPNGGFCYVRGAHPEGAAHWALSQVMRRVQLFKLAANKTGGGAEAGDTMDQDILKDAMRTATRPGGGHNQMFVGMEWARTAGHPFWVEYPQAGYNQSAENETSVSVDGLPCVGPTRWDSNGTGEFRGQHGLASPPHSITLLHKPADAPGAPGDTLPPEYVLWAPGYLVSFGPYVTAGWNNHNPPTALTHLLHSKGIWRWDEEAAGDMFSHVSRQANMQAFGFWEPAIHEARAAHRTLMFLDPAVVATASLAQEAAPVQLLLARALHAAALTHRTLVLPELPCQSPWIKRSNDTNNGGFADRRVIVVPGAGGTPTRCYTGAHSYEFCWPWDYVVQAFDPIAQRRAAAAHAPWDLDALLESRADVLVTSLSVTHVAAAMEQAPEVVRQVEKECADYFDKPLAGG